MYRFLLVMLFSVFCGVSGWDEALAAQSVLVAREGMVNEVRMGMAKGELLTTLGAPSRIKSEGTCYQYESLNLSVFFGPGEKIERIYLGRGFQGVVTKEDGSKASWPLKDEARNRANGREKQYYMPSPLLAGKATVEAENRILCNAAGLPPFPIEYRGNNTWYDLYSKDVLMKSKYVLDDEGMAFWFDQWEKPYSVVIYPAPRMAVVEAPIPSHLDPIHFETDRWTLNRTAVTILDRHVVFLKTHPHLGVTVEGHTDAVGSEAYNRLLAERRTASTCRFMADKGVPPSRLHCAGKGTRHPVAANETSRGRAENRRVEFKLTEAE